MSQQFLSHLSTSQHISARGAGILLSPLYLHVAIFVVVIAVLLYICTFVCVFYRNEYGKGSGGNNNKETSKGTKEGSIHVMHLDTHDLHKKKKAPFDKLVVGDTAVPSHTSRDSNTPRPSVSGCVRRYFITS